MTRAKTMPKSLSALKRKHSDRSPRAFKAEKKAARVKSSAAMPRFSKVRALGSDFSASQSTFHGAAQAHSPFQLKRTLRSLYTFFFLEMSLLVLWIAYRALTNFPIVFDEGIAKAVVFGMPVFWLASQSPFIAREMGLDARNMIPGMYLGVAIGGLYGFAAVLSQVLAGRMVTEASLYLTSEFWWLAFLAFLTSWWESLFFFGLPVQFLRSTAAWISNEMIGIFVVVLFLLFHAPLRILIVGPSPGFLLQMGILALFAVGQFVIYTRTKNMYAIVLSHLFWGLAIEIYG